MGPDILGGIGRGVATGNALRQFQRGREMDELFAQHGPGILAGDQNALRALAQVDPMAAWRITANNRQEQRLEQQHSLEIQRYAATISAQQAAAEAAAIERGVKAGMAAQTPEQWDQIVTSLGRDELVGQFDNRQAFINQYLGAADILKQRAGPQAQSPLGKIQADINSGLLPDNTPLRPSLAQSIFGGLGGMAAGGAPAAIPKMGKISDDHVMLPDENAPGGVRAEVVAGSETAREETKASRKAGELRRQEDLRMDSTLGLVDLNIKEVENGGFPVTGFVGDMTSGIAGTAAHDFAARQEGIDAATAFTELARMRANSPTGGAVGSLTDDERKALTAAIQVMKQSTSAPEYLRAAKAYKKLMYDLAYGEGLWAQNVDGSLWLAYDADPGDIMVMDAAKLRAIPIGRLTERQLDAYEARGRELGIIK